MASVNRRPVALTIAGTDSGGGAGVAADLKCFEAHGVWGTCAVVAVTAQNTLGVQDLATLPASSVRAQITSVAGDFGVDAAKTGMLASAELVEAVAAAVSEAVIGPLVVDPVFVSKHGAALLDDAAVSALTAKLLPLAAVVTPNLPEATRILGFEVDSRSTMEDAARALVDLGAGVAMVKGGHLSGEDAPDCVMAAGARPVWLEGRRLAGRHSHGTGCVLSAAICAELARGMDPVDACVAAKHFCQRAIAAAVDLGGGVGPVDPGWAAAL
ncbi:MAG TPA: bifunctional hydroxymethylpyrimidine kinase/phosphomethylpyrimidine kinase [Acidimicrobiales bacterium]|nr:bifunctional hydroxymethylpyrimidine kinase/phosphomethylpyrimidine kinase [Acidimicrobiales bacterium]